MPDSPGHEALFVRLYFDRHIMTRLAADLRGRGFDVLTTQEAGKDTASDQEQLAFETAEGRAILTFNIRDFAPLHQQCQATGRPHAGIIVFQQLGSRQFGLLLERMLRLLNHFTVEDLVGNFVHLELFKESRVSRRPQGGSDSSSGSRNPAACGAQSSAVGRRSAPLCRSIGGRSGMGRSHRRNPPSARTGTPTATGK